MKFFKYTLFLTALLTINFLHGSDKPSGLSWININILTTPTAFDMSKGSPKSPTYPERVSLLRRQHDTIIQERSEGRTKDKEIQQLKSGLAEKERQLTQQAKLAQEKQEEITGLEKEIEIRGVLLDRSKKQLAETKNSEQDAINKLNQTTKVLDVCLPAYKACRKSQQRRAARLERAFAPYSKKTHDYLLKDVCESLKEVTKTEKALQNLLAETTASR